MTPALHILVVDDDRLDRKDLRRTLRRAGFENPIHEASDGRQALTMLRGGAASAVPEPRLVVLDLNMPMMNGREVLAALRADPELMGTRVVVLSTSDAPADRASVECFEILGYFLKSDPSERLLRFLRDLDD